MPGKPKVTIARVQREVNELLDGTRRNMEKVLERAEKIEVLTTKAQTLDEPATRFTYKATVANRGACCVCMQAVCCCPCKVISAALGFFSRLCCGCRGKCCCAATKKNDSNNRRGPGYQHMA